MCVCVCLCCPLIYSGRQVCGRTNRGHTGFLHLPPAVLAFIFLARRIQPFLSLVDHEVELCSPLVGHFFGGGGGEEEKSQFV